MRSMNLLRSLTVPSGPSELEQAGLRLAARFDLLVRGPPPEDHRAPVLDQRVPPADLRLAVGALQPAVLPDGHHADHRQEAGAAPGQDVPRVGRDHHHLQGGRARPPQGGSLHQWTLYGGE